MAAEVGRPLTAALAEPTEVAAAAAALETAVPAEPTEVAAVAEAELAVAEAELAAAEGRSAVMVEPEDSMLQGTQGMTEVLLKTRCFLFSHLY